MASTKQNTNSDVNKLLHEKALRVKYGLIHAYNAKSYRENLYMFIMDVQ